MLESVKAAVKRYNMFEGSRSVTVALSGGADSVALLSVLLELRDEFGLEITAAHLNHSLRGAESDGDEEFVRELCKKLSVPLVTETVDVKSESERSGESIELAARRKRYEFLERVSKGLIATAHTATDNIETVLYNMARGTGLHGLCGIPPVRGRIIRPMISVTRCEVEAYCTQKGLQYRTDSSNLSDIYARNKIRHNAVPILLEVNSAAVENTARLSEILRQDESFLAEEAEKAFRKCYRDGGLNIDEVQSLHPSLQYRVVALLAEKELSLRLEHIHIEAVLSMSEKDTPRQSVKSGCFAVLKNGVLRFEEPRVSADAFLVAVDSLPFLCGNCTLRLRSVENFKKMPNVNNLSIENAIDYDKICGRLYLRSRLPGDKIRLVGRGCTKTFKNLLNERGLGRAERDSLVVLSDDNGVLWLSGFGVDERAAVDRDTENVLLIEIEENNFV
ncbi:MAG: tRNA lysidine(34) synthetase TilS [Ruminococcaceae bacterium]|nr:tRNA lysidine(34) synthetase TilS [Oscillospiraceae bacterium]